MVKRVDLSLSDKVKVVWELELPGVTQASVAKEYGISTSQASCLAKTNKSFFAHLSMEVM